MQHFHKFKIIAKFYIMIKSLWCQVFLSTWCFDNQP